MKSIVETLGFQINFRVGWRSIHWLWMSFYITASLTVTRLPMSDSLRGCPRSQTGCHPGSGLPRRAAGYLGCWFAAWGKKFMEPIAPKKVFISFGQGSRNLLEGSEGSSLQFGTARLKTRYQLL